MWVFKHKGLDGITREVSHSQELGLVLKDLGQAVITAERRGFGASVDCMRSHDGVCVSLSKIDEGTMEFIVEWKKAKNARW